MALPPPKPTTSFYSTCDATTCTQCVVEADHCQWSVSGEYCFNWFDTPQSGVESKIRCTSVILPTVIFIILAVVFCIAITIIRRKKKRKHDNNLGAPLITNPSYNYNYNQQQMYQPTVYIPAQQPQYQPVPQYVQMPQQQQPVVAAVYQPYQDEGAYTHQ